MRVEETYVSPSDFLPVTMRTVTPITVRDSLMYHLGISHNSHTNECPRIFHNPRTFCSTTRARCQIPSRKPYPLHKLARFECHHHQMALISVREAVTVTTVMYTLSRRRRAISNIRVANQRNGERPVAPT